MDEEAADARGALHVAGLSLNELRPFAVFRLRPAESAAARYGTRVEFRGFPAREIEIARVLGRLVIVDRVVAHAGIAATLADVVPEAVRTSLRCASAQQPAQRAVGPLRVRRVTGDPM